MLANSKVSGDGTESPILREWAPLTDLFSKLPIRSQIGLFPQDVNVTCLDVLPEFLALGTNLGVVYWYDRKKKDLQRLRCEKQNFPITIVKIISTVDYMVACGAEDGSINIFQIPKSYPDSIPENLKPKNKQVERYTVSQLHKSPITALEWSKNGMKLFSGDKNGCIVLTEIDFYMHICRSVEILNEAYEVVQLSYCQQKLLVSTTYRSVICQKQDKWKVCQVGKKDRKVLGRFGGLVMQNGPKMGDTLLYCSRPGLRIWIADCEGNVLQTLLFKDLLCKECAEVPIINPISRNLKAVKPQKEPSFGILLPFNDNLILTYNNDVIYILDPKRMAVISTMSHFRSVLWVATHKDEIFVLEEARSVIRISYRPEAATYDINSTTPTGSAFLPITTSIKDLTNKLQSTSIIPTAYLLTETMDDVNIHTDYLMVMNAEEAQESPTKRTIQSESEKKFSDIGKQQFSDTILFKHNKRKKKSSLMNASTSSLSSNSSEEKDTNFIRPTLMTLSSVGVLPDLRSPESIQSDIEYKEKILADVLSLNKVKISMDKPHGLSSDEENSEIIAHHKTQMVRKPEKKIVNCNIKKEVVINNGNATVRKSGELESPPMKNEASCSNGHKRSVTLKPISSTPPACFNIPNDWKLSDIQINTKADSTLSDNSLADWEII